MHREQGWSQRQIAEEVGLGQPATSEHLAVLRQAGVLLSRKEGKEVYFRISGGRVSVVPIDLLAERTTVKAGSSPG